MKDEKDKEEHEEMPYKFWKLYEQNNILKREEQVTFLFNKILKPSINALSNKKGEEKKILEQGLIMILLSYFDDLIEYMYTIKK